MALTIGSRVGVYEILAPLGAGGMGEVYRARDSKLDRQVAIKILPELFSADPDRVARFEREARALASLNHPNIAQIFGLEGPFDFAQGRREGREGQAGTACIVMELVEGPTLTEKLGKPQGSSLKAQGLPLDEVLRIAKQIAEALETAHEQGIVHRDLKPANIKVRDDGTVKVLDFGLAKVLDASPEGRAYGSEGAAALTNSPTMTSPAMTNVGIILGTAAYMSPEQARGGLVDARTDVWAFGCVLYEMLTGRVAFAGNSVSDTMAAILIREPDWSALPPPAAPLAGVLRRCLAKDPKARLRNFGDVRLLLDDTDVASVAPSAAAAGPGRVWIAAAAVMGIAVGAAASALFVQSRTTTIPSRVERFQVTSSQTDPFTAGVSGVNVAISPDGSRIVYTATRDGVPELVMRGLDQLDAVPIAGTEGASEPFFSPDGRQIAFVTLNDIRKVAVEGGKSTKICAVDPTFDGASWGSDDAIVYSVRGSLFRIPSAGGDAEKIASADGAKGEAYYDRPTILPGGQGLLYTLVLRSGERRIMARKLRGGEAAIVADGGFGQIYLPSGHLVYAVGDRIMAVRFDPDTLQTRGSPVTVQEGVYIKAGESLANIGVSSDGAAVYVSGRDTGNSGRLVWVDRHGAHVAQIAAQPLEFPRNVRLSPDGHRLVVTAGPPGLGQIWVYDVSGAAQPLKLTFQDHNTFPIWSPDGKQIAFMSLVQSAGGMWSLPADGSMVKPEPLLAVPSGLPPPPLDWSPDAMFVLFRGQKNLSLLSMNDRKVRPWLDTPFVDFGARFSPDGRWVAYASSQTGLAEVWVRPFPGPGAPVRVSSGGGHDPVWSRDGKELFYDNGPQLMSARVVSTAPDFRVDAPQALFEGGFVHDTEDFVIRLFDVAADGRFLMIEPVAATTAPSIVVAQHWDEEIKRLLR